MMPKQLIYAAITFAHDLFTALWIGGLLTLGLTVLPVSRKVIGNKQDTVRLMDAIQSRLRWLVYASILALAVTGALLARRSPEYGTPFSFDSQASALLSLKHLLVIAMVAIALARSVLIGRKSLKRAMAERVKMVLLYINMLLGIAVLAVTALGVAATSGAPGV